MLQRVFTRVSKGVARYSDRGSAAEHCSACRFFMSGGDCARVLGRVLPQGWCKYFSREAVQRWNPLWPMEGIPAPPGATLDLSFLTSGALDPRITFTRASTGTYFNSAGVMQTAATNAPRWDYNPATLALNGLLIEEARTNLLLQSGDVSNAGVWAKANFGGPTAPVVVANQTTAPDGTLTAASIAYPAVAAGGCFVYQSYTATANAFAASMWLRGSTGGETVYLNVTPNDGATYYRTSATLTTSWQRFTFATPALTAATWQIEVGVDMRDASETGKPAQTVYAWGAQVEQGAFATSYIATTGAAVTRAVDLCQMPVGAWFTPSTFSLFLEFYKTNALGIGAGFGDNSFGDNTAYLGDGSFSKIGTNSGTANAPSSSITNAANKECGTFNVAGLGCDLNAGGIGTYAAALVAPSGAIRLGIGSAPWAPGAAVFNGYVRRISYWPRVLSNVEMQQVTT